MDLLIGFKAETGQKAPSGKDGNFTADDGKPKNKKKGRKEHEKSIRNCYSRQLQNNQNYGSKI